MTRKSITRMGIAAIVVVLIAAYGVGQWWQWATQPYARESNPQVLMVSQGMTAATVAQELEQRRLIRSALVFRVLARSRQVDGKLLAGEYTLSAALSPDEIISRLLKGPDIVRVTIPEGYTTGQIIQVLVQNGLGTSQEFEKVVESDSFPYSFLAGAPAGPHRLEGFLFPDTYFFEQGSSPHAIIDTFLQRFAKELTPETLALLQQRKLSVHDWVTLSSLVEKEAAKASDRPLIASVFFNRLKIGMPLQSDPTIQFILGGPQRTKIYDKDLKIESPYNTYLHAGLPPGPIANPGDASLQAVLHPANTKYLYFVAKGDGYHAFAETYQQQLENEKKYQ